MNTAHFNKNLRALNSEQRGAVDAIEGTVIVIAGPGTGKTQVLTVRIANILHKTDTPANGILALTFTDAGVRAMRERLKDLIGKQAYEVEIATFHSFANSIIEEYADFFPTIIGARQADELERYEIIETIIKESRYELLRPLGDPLYYVSHVARIIKDIKKEGINPHAFEGLVKKQVEDFDAIEDRFHTRGKRAGEMKGKYRDLKRKIERNLELARAFETYEEVKHDKKLFDYEDALLVLSEALKQNDDFLLSLQERYLYILVDEHQDSNGVQNTIAHLLSSFHEDPNLFIVGDDKQAIYRFQGASPENFRFFLDRHPNAKKITLKKNYRSHQCILDAAHNLIAHNDTILPESKAKLEHASQRDLCSIRLFVCDSEIDEARRISEEVAAFIEREPQKTLAVLYRNNSDSRLIEEALERKGIAYAKRAHSRKEIHPYTEILLSLLSIAHEPSDEKLSQALFFDCFNLVAPDVFSFLESVRGKKSSISRELKNVPQDIAAAVNMLYELHKKSANLSFFELFEEALYSTGLIESVFRTKKERTILFEIQGLFTLARTLEKRGGLTLSSFLSYVARAREKNLLELRGSDDAARVTLSTVHGVKGLEYDAVCIANLENRRWGGKGGRRMFHLPELHGATIGADGNAEEDERRLFYVALTRAREDIVLTTSKRSEEGREYTPSRFLDELGDGVIRIEDTAVPVLPKKRVPKTSRLLDKEFVSSLFLKRTLNATAVNKYLKCPWEYFFLSLLRLPKTPPPSAAYGTAVHAALQHVLSERSRGTHLSPKDIRALLKKELDKTLLSETEKERYYKKGSEDLVGFVKHHEKHWQADSETERLIRGVHIRVGEHDLALSGKLDRVERTESGLIVTDFKTGKPKSRSNMEGKTKSGTGDYKRQLVFYSLLLEKVGEAMTEGVIDFIEPTQGGIYKQERFLVTEEDRDDLVTTIEAMAHDVLTLQFATKGCGKRDCEWCRLSLLVLDDRQG
jgi:DNA helicase-2/ATP-dependent DNA helicase PcrA